jgi:hypothetical protein
VISMMAFEEEDDWEDGDFDEDEEGEESDEDF